MKLTDKLDLLLKEKNLNRRQFSEQSGIPYMTIANFYEKGTENVKLSTLKKIATFFSVTLDYIAIDDVHSEESQKSMADENLTNNEAEIIKKYRALDEKGQHTVDVILDVEYGRCKDLIKVSFAARSKDGSFIGGTRMVDKDVMELLENTPQSDEDL